VERVNVVVIGGGVTGLASAIAVAERGSSVCVVERHPRPGLEASTHNSGVIHAGIYYPTGSLKARLCVDGRERLYAFCEAHNVPHARCGKLIVAADTVEVRILETLALQAKANGVDDLEIVGRDFIRRREPHVEGVAALWSPSTGTIESETFVRALARKAVELDVILLPGTRLEHGMPHESGFEVITSNERFLADTLVNAAGLYADDVSATIGGEPLTIYPVRGEYAEIVPAKRQLVNGLVYPLPDPSGHGLGIHLTRTTWGNVTIGPTARYLTAKDDYESNRVPVEGFHQATKRLIPSLKPVDLRLGGTGIRARMARSDERFADFLVRPDCRYPRMIHAAGIDSPGLTACLAIGAAVRDLVDDVL